MALLGFKRVLCLSPHPDDVELSMFGTVAKYPEVEFSIACCSTGGIWDTSSSVTRYREILDFWKKSGRENVKVSLLYSNISEIDEGGWVYKIESEFDFCTFDALFVPPTLDIHFEHTKIGRIGRALIRKKPLALLEYRTISTLPEWTPNFFVDIEETYEEKVKLLQSIGTQAGKVYFSEPVLNALHSDVLCLKQGVRKVEMYRILSCYD